MGVWGHYSNESDEALDYWGSLYELFIKTHNKDLYDDYIKVSKLTKNKHSSPSAAPCNS